MAFWQKNKIIKFEIFFAPMLHTPMASMQNVEEKEISKVFLAMRFSKDETYLTYF